MIEIITHPIFIGVLVFLAASGILMIPVTFIVASYCVYNCTLRRHSKEQWSRDIPEDADPLQKKMYDIGLEWARENAKARIDVSTERDGLRLCGEYYDLGYDRCVFVLSGRTESLRYGYYFGIPYAKNGYNVFVFDPRAHGLSDGEFNTVGFEESRDILQWVKFIREKFGVRSVIFHGICIGAAGGILALTDDDCPDFVDGIVTEGMYVNFGESMKNHIIERKRPVFILFDLVDLWMKHYTGHSMKRGPIDVIHKLNKPLLMLHGKQDIYSTPENAVKLITKAGCDVKSIVWFESGRHSMLRITDTELYDRSIGDFIKEISTVKI